MPRTKVKQHNTKDWSKITNPIWNVGIRTHAGLSANRKHNRKACSPASNPATYKHNFGNQQSITPLMVEPQSCPALCIPVSERNIVVQTMWGARCARQRAKVCETESVEPWCPPPSISSRATANPQILAGQTDPWKFVGFKSRVCEH